MLPSYNLKRRLIVLNVLLPFLMGTAIDLYVPSLPAIADYFHSQNYLVQLGVSLYMLGYGAGQIFFGILSDSYGRRKFLLASVILFACVSLIAIWAPNIYFLNVCRLLQGIAAAGFATVRAINMDRFSGVELTRVMTYISMSWALGPILGPFIGGYLQHYFGWQANFYFFSASGWLMLVYILFLIPETHHERLPFNLRNISQAINQVILHSAFWCYSLILSLSYGMLVIFNVMGPFLIQAELKYSVVVYGHIALFLGIGCFLGNTCSSFLQRYFHPQNIAKVGMIGGTVVSVGLLVLTLIFGLNLYVIIFPIFLLFVCCGLTFPNIFGVILNLFTQNAGITSAVTGTLQVGGVFLLSIFAAMLKTNSQLPLAIVYVVIMLVSLLLFVGGRKLEIKIGG